MKVVIETNFLLELALEQSDARHCSWIVELAEAGRVQLVLPLFCVAEAYQSVGEKSRRRRALARELGDELGQLRRSASIRATAERELVQGGEDVRKLLEASAQAHRDHLEAVLARVLAVCDTIPFDRQVLERTKHCAAAFLFDKMGDAAVCASVLHYLDAAQPPRALFVEKDRGDFSNPDLEQHLAERSCDLEFNIGAAAGRLHRDLAA
jgi:hypothetical protein